MNQLLSSKNASDLRIEDILPPSRRLAAKQAAKSINVASAMEKKTKISLGAAIDEIYQEWKAEAVHVDERSSYQRMEALVYKTVKNFRTYQLPISKGREILNDIDSPELCLADVLIVLQKITSVVKSYGFGSVRSVAWNHKTLQERAFCVIPKEEEESSDDDESDDISLKPHPPSKVAHKSVCYQAPPFSSSLSDSSTDNESDDLSLKPHPPSKAQAKIKPYISKVAHKSVGCRAPPLSSSSLLASSSTRTTTVITTTTKKNINKRKSTKFGQPKAKRLTEEKKLATPCYVAKTLPQLPPLSSFLPFKAALPENSTISDLPSPSPSPPHSPAPKRVHPAPAPSLPVVEDTTISDLPSPSPSPSPPPLPAPKRVHPAPSLPLPVVEDTTISDLRSPSSSHPPLPAPKRVHPAPSLPLHVVEYGWTRPAESTDVPPSSSSLHTSMNHETALPPPLHCPSLNDMMLRTSQIDKQVLSEWHDTGSVQAVAVLLSTFNQELRGIDLDLIEHWEQLPFCILLYRLFHERNSRSTFHWPEVVEDVIASVLRGTLTGNIIGKLFIPHLPSFQELLYIAEHSKRWETLVSVLTYHKRFHKQDRADERDKLRFIRKVLLFEACKRTFSPHE